VVTVWELADGTLESALQERLKDGRGPFSAQELLPWMEEAAKAIDFLNERGIYHRDIKPQNLFLLHGHVKVGDFGLVKQMGLSTVSHSGVGTRGYLPLECYKGKLVDWVDVYALCATYVRLRTGRDPFGENVVDMIKRQERGAYARGGLSAAEITCLDELLQPGAGQRWGRRPAREWVRELREAVQSEAMYGGGYGGKGQQKRERSPLPKEGRLPAAPSRQERFYTLQEAAEKLNVDPGELLSMVQLGQVRAFWDRGTLRFPASDVDKLAAELLARARIDPRNTSAREGDPEGNTENGAIPSVLGMIHRLFSSWRNIDSGAIDWAIAGGGAKLGALAGAIAGIIVGIYLAIPSDGRGPDNSPPPHKVDEAHLWAIAFLGSIPGGIVGLLAGGVLGSILGAIAGAIALFRQGHPTVRGSDERIIIEAVVGGILWFIIGAVAGGSIGGFGGALWVAAVSAFIGLMLGADNGYNESRLLNLLLVTVIALTLGSALGPILLLMGIAIDTAAFCAIAGGIICVGLAVEVWQQQEMNKR
jgi:hypothetical protein